MSVDKFGRYSKKDKGLIGPKGEGFNLTSDGNYDIQNKVLCNLGTPTRENDAATMGFVEAITLKRTNDGLNDFDAYNKRIRNVSDPEAKLDAVNFETHQKASHNCLSIQNGLFDTQSLRICNLGHPVDKDDAVTLGHMKDVTPSVHDDHWEFKRKRLSNVAAPIYDGEAVNILYLKQNTINKVEKNVFDAQDTVIRNVASPVSERDAVNLTYIHENTIQKDKNGKFDVKNTVIKNLSPPNEAGDAVNKAYLEEHIPMLQGLGFNFKNKRIQQVGEPLHDHDAVTLGYLKKNTITLEGPENHWNVHKKRITNLSKPRGLTDAVSKEYVKEALADFAYTMFKGVYRNNRARIPTESEWKMQVVQETSTWDQLFNIN